MDSLSLCVIMVINVLHDGNDDGDFCMDSLSLCVIMVINVLHDGNDDGDFCMDSLSLPLCDNGDQCFA